MIGRAISNHWNFASRLLTTIGNFLFRARIFLALALPLALPPSPASARVFWTGSGGETAGVLAPDAAWSRGYATMVKINGGRAGVEVWSASLSLEEAMESLRGKLNLNGAAIWFNGSGEMIWAIASDGERVYRFLLSSGFGPRSTHVFQISQTFEEFKASLAAPKTHMFKHAPAFPGSEPKSFLASEKTRTELASASSSATPGEVQDYYASQLSAAGWASPFSGRNSGFFIKGNEAILVSTQTTGDAGGCLIMLLHKPLAVAEGK